MINLSICHQPAPALDYHFEGKIRSFPFFSHSQYTNRRLDSFPTPPKFRFLFPFSGPHGLVVSLSMTSPLFVASLRVSSRQFPDTTTFPSCFPPDLLFFFLLPGVDSLFYYGEWPYRLPPPFWGLYNRFVPEPLL